MNTPRIYSASLGVQQECDDAPAGWPEAISRLERSHQALQHELLRLTGELETANRQLARQGRRADSAQLASLVAYEVRNGLVPVRMVWKLLKERLADEGKSEDLADKIESGLRALDATITDLLSFTSDRDPRLQWVNLREVVDDVCSLLSEQLSAQDVVTVPDVPRNLGVMADRKMLQSAILNLAVNALEAMPDGGRLEITSYHGPQGFELEVADSGPGLSEEARRRAFDPFHASKSGGTGLGLAIVDRIAELHGGDVLVANCPEGGAAYTLRFPSCALRAVA